MSKGLPLNEHIIRLKSHLEKEESDTIDFSNMLGYRSIDNISDYRYVLGGLLIKLAHENGGSEMVKKMLNSGKTEEDFYRTIEECLGVKREDLNEFIRKEIAKY